MRLKGKTALVTGSSRGVGQQIASGLAELGANIVIHGRTIENTTQTFNLLRKYDVKVHQLEGDLSDNKQISKLTNHVLDKFGGIDILYNNADIMSDFQKNADTNHLQQWKQTFIKSLKTTEYNV